MPPFPYSTLLDLLISTAADRYGDSARLYRLEHLIGDVLVCPPFTENEMQDLCLAIKANDYQVEGADKFYKKSSSVQAKGIVDRDLCFTTLAIVQEKIAADAKQPESIREKAEELAQNYRNMIGKERTRKDTSGYKRTQRPGKERAMAAVQKYRETYAAAPATS